MKILYFPVALMSFFGTSLFSQSVLPPEKQAIEQRYVQQRAVGAQNPARNNPNAPYVDVSEQPVELGIINDFGPPFPSSDANITSCWQGIQNGQLVRVYAGADGAEDDQGIVIVETDAKSPFPIGFQRLNSPVKAGALEIVAEQNGLLLLTSTTGSYVLTFDTGSVAFTSMIVAPPLIALSNQINVTTSGLVYSRADQTFTGIVTIKNISGGTINGPISLLLNSLSNRINLLNLTGTFNGSPFISAPTVTSLPAGGSTSITLELENPSNVPMKFTPLIYSGSLR